MSYGNIFKKSLSNIVQVMGETECHVVEIFEEILKFSEDELNKYPLAIRGLLREVFKELEFFINYFFKISDKDQSLFLQAIADLEYLEAELDGIKERIKREKGL